MKSLKLILPSLVFVLAIGLAFASNNAQTGVYIDRNGPEELEVNPCQGATFDCRVAFESDPDTSFLVYTDETLSETVKSTTQEPHIIPDQE